MVAGAISAPGGYRAVWPRVAEHYVEKPGIPARENKKMILSAKMADISSIIATAVSVIKQTGDRQDGNWSDILALPGDASLRFLAAGRGRPKSRGGIWDRKSACDEAQEIAGE